MGPYKGYEYLGVLSARKGSPLEVHIWGTRTKVHYYSLVRDPSQFFNWGANFDKRFWEIWELIEEPDQEDLWV